MTEGRAATRLIVAVVVGVCMAAGVNQQPASANGILNEDALRNIIDSALPSWRKLDANGASCASCHAPDGFDLAWVGFSRETILRRARPHVPEGDAVAIANMIQAHRLLHDIPQRDPLEFRPFQPGGRVLPGETSAERDLAFAVELARRGFSIVTERIETLEQARAAANQLVEADLTELPCGIPFNRWSEDIHHGSEHGTLGDWMPDLPHRVKPGAQLAWRNLENRYLSDPSEENFWALWDGAHDLLEPQATGPFRELVTHKYRAALIAQHEFRMEATGGPALASGGPMAFVAHPLAYEPDDEPGRFKELVPNPAWHIGEVANFYRTNYYSYEELGVPSQVQQGLAPDTDSRDQMAHLHLPWTWLGWLHDRGRQRTSRLARVRNANYLAVPLFRHDGGYPIHGAFAIAAKMAVHSVDEDSWVLREMPVRVQTNYGNLMRDDLHIVHEPQDPTALWVYRRILCNSFRMTMLLLEADYELHNSIHGQPESVNARLRAMWEYLYQADSENLQSNTSIFLRALSAVHAYAKSVGLGPFPEY